MTVVAMTRFMMPIMLLMVMTMMRVKMMKMTRRFLGLV